MKLRRAFFTLLLLSAINPYCGNLWAQTEPIDVKVNFLNTTDLKLSFCFIEETEEEVDFVQVHQDKLLEPNKQRTYESLSGLKWEVVHNGSPIASYTCSEDKTQNVDIKELVSWQTPVKINFMNTLDTKVDIWTMMPDGKKLIVDDLQPGTELRNQPLPSLPGQLWTVCLDDEVFVADYAANNEPVQTVDIKETKSWFEPVNVHFKNKTSDRVKIYFVSGDGKEILLTPKFLQTGQTMTHPNATPAATWRIQSGAGAYAKTMEFTSTNEQEQTVEISDEKLKKKKR